MRTAKGSTEAAERLEMGTATAGVRRTWSEAINQSCSYHHPSPRLRITRSLDHVLYSRSNKLEMCSEIDHVITSTAQTVMNSSTRFPVRFYTYNLNQPAFLKAVPA